MRAMRFRGQRRMAQALMEGRADVVGMALLSGMLVMPIVMLLTKLIATTMPPLALAPSAPVASAPASTPIELWSTAPPTALPTESVPPPLAPSVAAPDTLPTTLPTPAARS